MPLCSEDSPPFISAPHPTNSRSSRYPRRARELPGRIGLPTSPAQLLSKKSPVMKRSRSFDYDADSKLPDLSLDVPDKVAAHFNEPDAKTCPHCRQAFSRGRSLREHISRAHQSRRQFECERCSYSSSRKDDLKRHTEAKHVKSRRVVCEICNFSTSSRTALVDHVHTEHNANRFKCLQCGQSYNNDEGLQAHIRSKHIVNRTYMCRDCGSRYSAKSSLKKHQLNSRQCHSRRL